MTAVDDMAQMECGVCWYIYDPVKGDGIWPVQPGTSFLDVPADWRCPVCDAPQEKFLKVDHD